MRCQIDATQLPQTAARARGGDTNAFAMLYEATHDRVYSTAHAILRDQEKATDVTQETYARALERLDQLREPAAVKGWLLRIARNLAVDVRRREQRLVLVADVNMTPEATTSDEVAVTRPVEIREVRRHVAAVLGGLQERDRLIVAHMLADSPSNVDAARAVGVPPSQAQVTVQRVRRRLRSAISAWLLWNGGNVRCRELKTTVTRISSATFNRDLMRAVTHHRRKCISCRTEVTERLEALADAA